MGFFPSNEASGLPNEAPFPFWGHPSKFGAVGQKKNHFFFPSPSVNDLRGLGLGVFVFSKEGCRAGEKNGKQQAICSRLSPLMPVVI